MKLAASLAPLCLLAVPAIAWGQYAPPAEHSVIQPAGYGWRNHVTVAESCGCSVQVRADSYDQPCYFRCGLHPFCFLQRVHRMLDCLLPCNKCCGPICCLLGGRCGCGGVSCCGPTCCAPGCGPGLPGFSDPFIDDPVTPPKPMPEAGTDVRYHPLQSITPARTARTNPSPLTSPRTPWKVTTPSTQTVPVRLAPQPRVHRGMTVIAPPVMAKPQLARQEQSVLRRTSAEEPAPLPAMEAARPIVRSQSPEESSDERIPFNPLRGR